MTYFMGRWSARLASLFTRYAGVQDGQRILDVGCGTGSLSRTLLASGKAISVVGVDPAEDYVAFVRQGILDPRADFLVSIAESLPFPNESFDAAMALLVLQEIGDPGRAVREIAKTIRPSGTVAACLWDFRDAMPMFSLFRKQPRPWRPMPWRVAEPSGRPAGSDFRHWPSFGPAPVLRR